jgi:hypothetical protein
MDKNKPTDYSPNGDGKQTADAKSAAKLAAKAKREPEILKHGKQ